MSQTEQAQTAAEPLFHDMDGRPVYIGDRVELVSEELFVKDAVGKVITVDRDNTPVDDVEEAMLAMVGRRIDEFFQSDTQEPGLAYHKEGVRKVEVQ